MNVQIHMTTVEIHMMCIEINMAIFVRDPIDLEHCKCKLEQSIPIVASIFLPVNRHTSGRKA